MMKRSKGEKIFAVFNTIILIGLSIVCLIPMWHVIMASVSDPYSVGATHSFIFYPLEKPNVEAYKIILRYQGLWRGYLNTIIYTVSQCFLAAFCSCIGGYIMARKQYRYRGLFTIFLLIPMFFNGGMIPTFMVMQTLGFIDKMIVMILPGSLNILYFFFMRLAIGAVPESLSESARLDGAGELRILIQIIMPLCMPTVAVVILFTAVAKWNDFMSPLIYLPTASDLYPLQMHIRNILNNANDITGSESVIENAGAYSKLVQYATIVVSTLPIICVYPFVQKYFVKGILIGSVKG